MESRWSNDDATGLTPLELLVYVSRLMGQDATLVLWGGGNTSLKQTEVDFRGRETRVLRVKGSGSDMKSVRPGDFPGVRIDDVLPLIDRDAAAHLDPARFCVALTRRRDPVADQRGRR